MKEIDYSNHIRYNATYIHNYRHIKLQAYDTVEVCYSEHHEDSFNDGAGKGFFLVYSSLIYNKNGDLIGFSDVVISKEKTYIPIIIYCNCKNSYKKVSPVKGWPVIRAPSTHATSLITVGSPTRGGGVCPPS